MNTPTHLLISVVALAKSPDDPVHPSRGHYAGILMGALVPDLAIFAMFGWERLIRGVSEVALWRDVYWQEPWQTVVAIGNSAPLYAFVLLAGILYRSHVIIVFSLSALLHLLFDFPVHHNDAHPHFWPFSDWRFVSPVSYWDNAHYGGIISVLEIAFAVVLVTILWRRFRTPRIHACLTVALISYLAVPIYFTLMIH